MELNFSNKQFVFQIEDEKSCSYDYVDIYGGLDDYSGPLYGRYCGINVRIIIKK